MSTFRSTYLGSFFLTVRLYIFHYFRLIISGKYFFPLPYFSTNRNSIISNLHEYGYCVIPDYFSKQECALAVSELKDAFASELNSVLHTSDKRIFGIESISSVARKINQDPHLNDIARIINCSPTYCAFTLANWLQSGNYGSSGNGWHRDSFLVQFKAMVYLTDVLPETGAFQIIPFSHKLPNILKSFKWLGFKYLETRYSEAAVRAYEDSSSTSRITLSAPAGTLILFNSTAIHQGSPIQSGERYALTNYYYSTIYNQKLIHDKFFGSIAP